MAELDAAESKKQKSEQVEMAKEACLCFVTCKKLFVIKLSNLKKQEVDVKDWACVPPAEFDLDLELPEPDLCPFEFDSKIYMAASSVPPIIFRKKSVSLADVDPFPIYEFNFEKREIVPAESLDDAPLPFHDSFIANTPGSGDVYFHIDMKPWVKDSSGFYVLCSGSRVWKPLIGPPATGDRFVLNSLFVLDNNLFLSWFASSDFCSDSCLARFDPIKEIWTVESADNNVSKFLKGRLISGDDHGRITFPPNISVSLPGLGSSNYTVCLTYEHVEDPHPSIPLQKVFAILVNHQNGRVALYQYLDECFEGIQPRVMVRFARFNLVDLGNGKVCAILSGNVLKSSALWISVFTLSLLKDFAPLQLDSGAPPMERDFLQVTVHRKNVYTMQLSELANYIRHAFVWPPTKGRRFQHRTTLM